MKIATLKFGNIYPDLTKSSLILYVLYIAFSLSGFGLDINDCIKTNNNLILQINVIAITIAVLSFSLFFLRKTNLQLTTLLFSYAFAANLIISDIYYAYYNTSDWQVILYRDAFIFAISVVITGFICHVRHVFILNMAYVAMLVIILSISMGNFSKEALPMILILVLGFSITVVFYKQQLTKTLKQKIILQQEVNDRDKEILQKKTELMKDKSEHLQDLIHQKNRELTSNALLIAQHNERGDMLLRDLQSLYTLNTEERTKKIREIESKLLTPGHTQFWEGFQKRFEDVHHDFYSKLADNYPNLSPAEHKLAAFIRLGLTSKDIASLTSNTKESIDVSRSRLRKKLQLKRSDNLESFLVSL